MSSLRRLLSSRRRHGRRRSPREATGVSPRLCCCGMPTRPCRHPARRPDSLSTHSNPGLYHHQHPCSAVWVGQGFLPAAQGTTAQSAVTICSARSTPRIAQVSLAKWVLQLFPLLQLHFALSPGPVWVPAPRSLFPPLPLPAGTTVPLTARTSRRSVVPYGPGSGGWGATSSSEWKRTGAASCCQLQ